MGKISNESISDYFSSLPDEKKEICEALRMIVVNSMPGAIEMIAHGALGYSISPSSFDRIVYIAPQSGWVNLGFFFGSDIPDPDGLLIGNGIRMRHIKIKNLTDIKNKSIERILKAAWKKAPSDIEKVHKRKK